MAEVGTPHVMKVMLQFTPNPTGIIAGNIFYLEDDSDAIFADLAGVRTAIENAVHTNLLPVAYTNVDWIGVELTDVRTVPFGGGAFPFVAAQTGALTGSGQLPSSVSIAIKKLTGSLGRSHRGRWYWYLGDVDALTSDGDSVDATQLGNIEAALGAFQDDVETALAPALVGIVSYVENKTPRSSGLFEHIIGWAHADVHVDSQRRRLLGRGT